MCYAWVGYFMTLQQIEHHAAPPHEGTSSSPGTIARAGMLAALDVCVWPRGP